MRRSWGWAGLASALFFLVSCGGGADTTVQQASAQRLAKPAAMSAAKTPLAGNVVDNTAIFTWAQWHYSQLFTGGYQSGNYQDGSGLVFNYRYYPTTQNYLGIASGNVYVLGPATGGNIFLAGSLESFTCQVFPANCPNNAPPGSDGVSVAGLYYNEFGLMLMDPDGSFVGWNPNSLGTRADVFTGTASVAASSWSATNATFGTYLPGNSSATRASANITSTYVPADSMTVTFAVTGATPVSTRMTLLYHPQSRSSASLAMVGGLYSTPEASQSVFIDPNTGAMSGTIWADCAISGTVSVSNSARNIYKIQATFSGSACPASAPVQFLAMYDDVGIQEQALRLYGTTTSGDLQFVFVNIYRALPT